VSWVSGTDLNSAIDLPANSTTYFFIQATTTLDAAGGRTIGISGINNELDFSYIRPNPAPTLVNNQSDKAGLQTIVAPTVTYSTEALPGGDAEKGPSEHLMYVLKVTGSGIGTASFNNVSIRTTGDYTTGDIKQFSIYRNSSPDMSGATYIGYDDRVANAGETLNFGVALESIAENETRYYLITAEIDRRAYISHTFGINGNDNGLNITYINNATVINNQTNAAGLRTISGPSITYSTVPLDAAGIGVGSSDNVVYILKAETGSIPFTSISQMSLKTAGNYAGSDFYRFEVWRNTTPTMTGATKAWPSRFKAAEKRSHSFSRAARLTSPLTPPCIT
jgi:hypothetical protein